jgi:probable rRNA maturation factor
MSRASTRAEKPQISVRNFQRKVRVDIPALQRFAERALMGCLHYRRGSDTQLRRLSEISIVLISDRRMCDLHRRFLNKSDSTDVITFDHGEIFISVETARKHARRFSSSVLHEVQLYIIHGLLHLHGFDHRGEADARAMDELQKKILERIANAQR